LASDDNAILFHDVHAEVVPAGMWTEYHHQFGTVSDFEYVVMS